MTLEEALKKHQDALLALPGVTGVGLGEKDGRPAIAVFVDRSVPEIQLAPERIPKALEGFPVDVRETLRVGPKPG